MTINPLKLIQLGAIILCIIGFGTQNGALAAFSAIVACVMQILKWLTR